MPTALASGVQLHITGGFITNTALSDGGNILYNTTIATAIRQGELLNLMLGDYNRSEATLHIRRTSSLSLAYYPSTFGEHEWKTNENSDEQTLSVSYEVVFSEAYSHPVTMVAARLAYAKEYAKHLRSQAACGEFPHRSPEHDPGGRRYSGR
jgi:hypothetical protein